MKARDFIEYLGSKQHEVLTLCNEHPDAHILFEDDVVGLMFWDEDSPIYNYAVFSSIDIEEIENQENDNQISDAIILGRRE